MEDKELSFVEEGGQLKLKHGQNYYSVYDPDYLFVRGYWDYMSILPGLNSTKSMLVIGFGCGTIASQVAQLFPEVKTEGVEKNSEVVELGKKYFSLPEDLVIHLIEAEQFLFENHKRFDYVCFDIYEGVNIPEQFKTLDFFESVKKHITENGFLAMNFADDLDLMDARENILSAFSHVYSVTGNNTTNTILVAADFELDFEKIEHFNKDYAPEGFRFEVEIVQ